MWGDRDTTTARVGALSVPFTIHLSEPEYGHFFFKIMFFFSFSKGQKKNPDIMVKVLFRRQVYSNSSTGLEKSVQEVWNTPPDDPPSLVPWQPC